MGTSTDSASLTTVTTDPCQEVLDIIKQKDEIIRNLTQQQEIEAQEEMPEATTATAGDTQTTDAPVGTTTLYPMIADTTSIVMDIITATVAPGDLDYVDMTEEMTEEPPRHQGLREVKMEMRTVLSYNPYKGVVSDTKLHQDVSTVMYSSPACDANRKLVVSIPDICGHGPSVNTILSWVRAGYCVLACNYKSASW